MFRQIKLFGVLMALIVFSLCASTEAATNWNTNVIQAKGEGLPAAWATTPAQARMSAKNAAIADARRNLLAIVKGVHIDATTTVENYMVQNDVIIQKVNGVVQGARIVAESSTGDGGYQVTLEMPIFGGKYSLAETVIERPTTIEPIPTPAPDYRPPVDYTPPSIPDYRPTHSAGNYTGLIIDCRGLGSLNPVMSPVIKNSSGQKIYGHKNLDYDRIIREGMASYANDMSMTTRAGSNPLVVRAIRLEDLNATPVVSMEDADMILYENDKTHFLENIAVVFFY